MVILWPGGHINGYFSMQMPSKHSKDNTVRILSHFMQCSYYRYIQRTWELRGIFGPN